MSERFKLLKDTPTAKAGVIFEHQGAVYVATNGDHYDPDDVEGNTEWFAPITEPDRPYPFLPYETWDEDSAETICYLALPTLKSPMSIEYGEHGNAEENYALYRTKEDAELALKGLPLYNKAVQALLNRDATKGPGDHWHVFTDLNSTHHRASGPCKGSCTTGVIGPEKEDAEAVADLFNYFLTPSSNGG